MVSVINCSDLFNIENFHAKSSKITLPVNNGNFSNYVNNTAVQVKHIRQQEYTKQEKRK